MEKLDQHREIRRLRIEVVKQSALNDLNMEYIAKLSGFLKGSHKRFDRAMDGWSKAIRRLGFFYVLGLISGTAIGVAITVAIIN